MLNLKNVAKIFHDHQKNEFLAVDFIDLVVPAGKICVLLGTSGSGKTTTLKMINRLVEPTHGEIFIDEQNILTKSVNEIRKNIGYVIQHIGLFPNMTIFENITVVPNLLGWNKDTRYKRALELLDMVNLPTEPSFLNRYPFQLSGGQQQRVGVIRALAARPALVLMDEPFSSIDPINRGIIQDEFKKLQQDLGFSVVFVSHDLDEAIKLGDSIAMFNHGKIVQHDQPSRLLKHPKNNFVKDFLGKRRMIKGLTLFKVANAFRKQDFNKKDCPAISLEDSLADAVSNLYLSKNGELACLDKDGKIVGVINHNDIQKFLSI